MKDLLRNLFNRFGLVITRTSNRGTRYLRHSPRNAFESTLLREFPDLAGLQFIQIGANDGRRTDPIAPFIDAYGWSGLMIEPLSVNFAALQRHRGSNPRLRLRRVAVDATAGRREIYDLRPGSGGLPDWAHGLASFDRTRVARTASELGLDESAILTEEVETITWNDAWTEFGANRCDLLVLDTEGYDITLLRLADLARRRPRLIHFEHACASSDDRLAVYGELIELGYELATYGGDTTACLPVPDA